MRPRGRDLLQTAVVVGIALTPAWLGPSWLTLPWVLGVGLLLGPMLWLTWTHAPFVPTPSADLERIVAALELGPGQRFVDLGSGDGRVLRAVHRATGADGLGIEAAPGLWLWSWLASWTLPGVQVRLGDLRSAPLPDVDAVYVWGTGYFVGTEAFAAWLRGGLRPGARVVSYGEPLHDWTPDDVDRQGVRPVFRYLVSDDPQRSGSGHPGPATSPGPAGRTG